MDNSVESDLNKTITWQFDNAEKLIALIGKLKEAYKVSTQDFFDQIPEKIANIDATTSVASDYNLSVWGRILNCRRPIIDGSPITSTLYRKILKARFSLLNSHGTMSDYATYIYAIFGSLLKMTDNNDMSVSFSNNGMASGSELYALWNTRDASVFIYPCGVRENASATGYMFAIPDSQSPSKTLYPQAGGLDESSFNWN